jgi:RimJ/RimL family protein N-acetyltransferase
MQESWRKDGDKLTFIACLPPLLEDVTTCIEIVGGKEDTEERMIGDVNLFLFENEVNSGGIEHIEFTEGDAEKNEFEVVGELEIMIAQAELQGHGYGTAVLTAFLWYITTNLSKIISEYALSLAVKSIGTTSLKYLRVKIDAENERSIKLFERVGFRKISEIPNYFGELELRWDVTEFMVEKGGATPKMVDYRLGSILPSEE